MAKDALGHGSEKRGVLADTQVADVLGQGHPKSEQVPIHGAQTYLRIGDWHPSGKSRNYAKGTIEKGVSVYQLDRHGQPIAPDGEWAETDMRDRLKGTEPKHLVQGRHVGIGHDGEPLLKNPKIVGTWKPK